MDTLFAMILNMSAAASLVILAVLLARALLARAPRKFSYLLWAVVGFRLCCPVSFQSVFSLFRLVPVSSAKVGPSGTSALYYQAPAPAAPALPPVSDAAALPLPQAPAPIPPAPVVAESAQFPWQTVLMLLWVAGVVGMLLYAAVGELRLRHSLATATRLRGDVFQAEQIRSPFILGLVRPRIYVPYGLDGQTLSYVLAHERFHLRHGDHLVRRFAFLLLALHWFNPLCWLAFYLMGKDMELRCDEGVLKKNTLDPAQYSRVLLSFATNRRFSAAAPLAFGETGVKTRIVNVLRWKKPRRAITVAALLVTALVVAACAANPAGGGQKKLQTVEECGVSSGGLLALRAEPDPSAQVLCQVPEGSFVLRLEERDGWSHCICGTYEGWMPSDRITVCKTDGPLLMPDFLTREQQNLYLKALTLFETYSPNINGSMGYVDFYTPTEEEFVFPEVVYPEFSQLRTALQSVFTPEYAAQEFALDQEVDGRQEKDERLYFTQGLNEGILCAELTGYKLQEKSSDRIAFALLLHFGTAEDWETQMTVELVNTPEGWRFSQFSSRCDSRWQETLGPGFDPWLAMDEEAQITEKRDENGRLLEKEIRYSGRDDYRVNQYGPDGALTRVIWYTEDGGRAEEELNAQGSIVQSIRYGPHGELQQTIKITYNEQGQMLKTRTTDAAGELTSYFEWEFKEDGTPSRSIEFSLENGGSIQLYNEAGLVLEENKYNQAKELQEIIRYTYDDQGQRTKEGRYTADGKLFCTSESEYNADNQRVRKVSTNYENGKVVYQDEEHYEYKDGVLRKTIQNTINGQTYFTEYNEQGQAIRQGEMQGDDLKHHDRYSYNENGRTSCIERYDDQGTLETAVEYTYNEKGEKLREVTTEKGKVIKDRGWTYDANGVLQKESEDWWDQNGAYISHLEWIYNEEGQTIGSTLENYDPATGQIIEQAQASYENGKWVGDVCKRYRDGVLYEQSTMRIVDPDLPTEQEILRYDKNGNVIETIKR